MLKYSTARRVPVVRQRAALEIFRRELSENVPFSVWESCSLRNKRAIAKSSRRGAIWFRLRYLERARERERERDGERESPANCSKRASKRTFSSAYKASQFCGTTSAPLHASGGSQMKQPRVLEGCRGTSTERTSRWRMTQTDSTRTTKIRIAKTPRRRHRRTLTNWH